MPADATLKLMNSAHRALLAVSCGRLGWEAGGMPVIELTTVGRRSGKRRSVMLTSPLTVGESLVIVASRGGDDRHPSWFLNLRDQPAVQVSIQGGPAQARRARIATRAERARMWPQITAAHKNYADYQQRTEREIPLVLLDPV